MYGVLPYFISKIMADSPILILAPTLSCIITYFGLGLENTALSFFGYLLAQLMTAQAAASIGYLISSLFNNEQSAQALAPLMIMPMILFGGLLSNTSSMLDWLSWIQYLSPIKYCTEALIYNEFRNDPHGVQKQLTGFVNYNIGYWGCIFIFVGLVVFFRVISFIVFRCFITKF